MFPPLLKDGFLSADLIESLNSERIGRFDRLSISITYSSEILASRASLVNMPHAVYHPVQPSLDHHVTCLEQKMQVLLADPGQTNPLTSGVDLFTLFQQNESLLRKTDAKINSLMQTVNDRFDVADLRFDDMEVRFDAIDTRLNGMDARFDAIDTCLNGMDARFDAIDTRLDGIDTRLDDMNARFDAMEARSRNMETTFQRKLDRMAATFQDQLIAMTAATNARFDHMDSQIKTLRSTIFNGRVTRPTDLVSAVICPNQHPS